ncbi:MAG: D-proline reductase (dithiol) PrdB [Acidimicrobiales bacterium]|jgi:D-proline reductase (dithiol) PrdB
MNTDSAFRSFVSYIDKSREFYAAQGYDRAYRWASPSDQPAFQPVTAPLSTLRLGLITTAFPLASGNDVATPEVPYAQAVEPLPTTRFTADTNRDTSAAASNELGSFLPLARMIELVAAHRLGSLSPRFYGVPFDYSQRRTVEQDAPTVLEFLRADGVDVAMLVPHCPVCHQSVSLVARHLEANGIPTVVVGSARDIVEEIGVPRFLFVDFPLGYPTGRPGDSEQQRKICEEALDLLEGAWTARTTAHANVEWGDDAWRSNYMRIDDTTSAALSAAGAKRRQDQGRAKGDGRARLS